MITKFKHQECFSHILKCEDHWMEHSVFMAGFGSVPRKSSMMAYGTILDFTKFEEAWKTIKDEYSTDCWKEMCEYWICQHYLSPISVMLVCGIYRHLELKYEIKDGKFKDLTKHGIHDEDG